ncbi:MAG: aldose 1-epimerase family protein [Acidobacteriia bacterium]|nr:aldose 1-epimerase family protein [Terriglobia bacterium]
MVNLFGRAWTREELIEHVGDISQLGGVRNVIFSDGSENGVRAIEVRTGSGFRFTVLPDRGMDICEAEYAGRSLCWRSYTGDVAPAFFEPEGAGWLRGFFGGLLTTCGLTSVGPPGTDEGEALGLHGRVSYVPARNVYAGCEWEGDECKILVQGRVSERSALGPKLTMTRRIQTMLGSDILSIDDIIENEGHEPVPFMMLYHVNFGFPLLAPDTVLVSPSRRVFLRGGEEVTGPEVYRRFHGPQSGFSEVVFRHEMSADPDGYVTAALVNRGVAPFAAYLRYRMKELPHMWQWKMLGKGAYTVALEPANCWVEPRAEARKRGNLAFLSPGDIIRHRVEIGVCASAGEIERMETRANAVVS